MHTGEPSQHENETKDQKLDFVQIGIILRWEDKDTIWKLLFFFWSKLEGKLGIGKYNLRPFQIYYLQD